MSCIEVVIDSAVVDLLRTCSGSILLDPIHPCATLYPLLCILVVLSAVQHIHSLCHTFDYNCKCHHRIGPKLPALQTFPCAIIVNVSFCFWT